MYQDLPTEAVRPAEDNLRRRVGDVSDIVASIPTHGIIEPLVVSPQDDGTYLIVAGHRRHAAAVKAGLDTVPCVVRSMSDEERVLAALIENGLRHDLRPTEEAGGYSAWWRRAGGSRTWPPPLVAPPATCPLAWPCSSCRRRCAPRWTRGR